VNTTLLSVRYTSQKVSQNLLPEGQRFGCEKNAWTCVHRVVYYESIKREVKTRPIYECRCHERLTTCVRTCVHDRTSVCNARALSLIATELKKGESRGGKNCHAETMMNTKS
jgi:hypothetical protein